MVDVLAAHSTGRVIAVDATAIHDLFRDSPGPRAAIVREATERGRLLLPPPVLGELLADPGVPPWKAARLAEIPLLEILDGYWQRVGLLRALVRAELQKALLLDCLIAQACIGNDVPLLTYDPRFERFERAGLKLL